MNEEELAVLPQQREPWYAELWFRVPDAVVVLDDRGRLVDANPAAQALLGPRSDELPGAWTDVLVADPGREDDLLGSIVDGSWRGDVELRRGDTTARLYGRSFVLRPHDPRLLALVLSQDRPGTDGQLVESQLAAIVEGSNDAIFTKTLDGVITSWNPGAQRIYGYRPEDVIGRNVEMLAPPDRKHEIGEILERLRRGERVRDLRTKRVTHDGREVDVWLSISPIRDAQGRLVGASTIARDLTELVRTERELRQARDQLAIITRGSADGLTIQDANGRLVYANDRAARMSGFPDGQTFVHAPIEQILGRFEMRDQQGDPFPVERLPGRRVLAGESYAEAMIRVRDLHTGEDSWRLVRASPVLGAAGEIRYVVNVFHDLTELKRAEEQLRFQAVLLETQAESSNEGILVIATDGRVISTNRRFAELWQIPDEIVGTRSNDAMLAFVRERVADPDAFVASVRDLWEPPRDVRDDIALTDGRIFERYMTPLVDEADRLYGRIVFFRDVTEERRREQRQRFLADASRELMTSLDYERTISRIARMAVPGLADWCSVDVIEPDARIRQLAVAHVDPAKLAWAEEYRRRFPVDLDAPRGLGNVIRMATPELYPYITPEMLKAAARTPEQLESIRQLGLHSLMIVPLIARGRTLGAMTFAWAESRRIYGEDDLRLAEDIAARAALALDNARLYHERDTVARTLQESLMPGPLPTIAGLELSARYRAAGEGIEVGGDFYDVFATGEDAWAFVIGDVCGKGPRAATLMAAARHTIRTAAMQHRRPSEVLRTLNAALQQHAEDQWFCTVCYVRVRRNGRHVRLTVCSGGHPLPVLIRENGTLETVGRPGTLLGVFDDVEVGDVAVDLRPGDTLVLYTDGVTDERSNDAEFGEERLFDVLREAAGCSPEVICDAVERAVGEFRPVEPTDDVALVVARVNA